MDLGCNVKNQLISFLCSAERNKWISNEQLSVYVRKGFHNAGGEILKFLDLASVEVDPDLQRNGLFKQLLALFQEITPYQGVYVENVLNPHLAKYLYALSVEDPRWVCIPEYNCFAWMK